MFDSTQTPHVRAEDLCAAFGVKPGTASNKAKPIRDLFEMVGSAVVPAESSGHESAGLDGGN